MSAEELAPVSPITRILNNSKERILELRESSQVQWLQQEKSVQLNNTNSIEIHQPKP